MHPELDPSAFGLAGPDMESEFLTGGLGGVERLALSSILEILRGAYCGTIGTEYMHISTPAEKQWIRQRTEDATFDFPEPNRAWILHKLNQAEAFEAFLHKKYIGHKRFSLEGAESLIPMLDAILGRAAEGSMLEAVIGMAHRGRLNVLANIVGRSYADIFAEFEGSIDPETIHGSGDVRYHLGAKGTFETPDGALIPVSIVSNPAHVESVDPVVEGFVRARRELVASVGQWPILPILIHGDAAFAGQGVVAETLNLSQLRGYKTGGTVHVIVNNQLGFTTAPGEARSSTYPSDVAKMVQAPIFHVNGGDPEACVRVAQLAFDYRQRFNKDVVIDLWCYRRWGHNETDEPSFTQPLMYARIAKRKSSTRQTYARALLERGLISEKHVAEDVAKFERNLQEALDATRNHPGMKAAAKRADLRNGDAVPDTAIDLEALGRILKVVCDLPSNFSIHPKLGKWLEARSKALETGQIDWSLAEALALGSLLRDGISIRLAGEDTRRGTFSQRHAVLIDQSNGAEHTPLAGLQSKGSRLWVYDSALSEFAALGFEYGYSAGAPKALVLWEAQFGDFVNGAQVVVDQFISSGEDKWDQPNGVVMLLPHGFEGQGPEHSSARLERFLQLAAEGNMTIAAPSTPAQFFHLLRRQGMTRLKRPLVVLTPKLLLRAPAARSKVAELTDGQFHQVLADPVRTDPGDVSRVILCSGKIFYELKAARDNRLLNGLVLLRIEQLYPFPLEQVVSHLAPFPNAEVVWVQEEPENMGAWRYVRDRFLEDVKVPTTGITRPESASPATGSARAHEKEQKDLIDLALGAVSERH